jgi:hypothetical protein
MTARLDLDNRISCIREGKYEIGAMSLNFGKRRFWDCVVDLAGEFRDFVVETWQ